MAMLERLIDGLAKAFLREGVNYWRSRGRNQKMVEV